MSCESIKELILEYPDGDLTQGEKIQVETHLRECKGCNLFYRQSSELWDLLGRWGGVEPEKDFVATFWDRVSEEDIKKGKGVLDFLKDWKLGWAVAVAVAVILVVSVISFNVFQPDIAKVVITERDIEDEELLIRLERVTSRDTAKSLEVYGPWGGKIEGSKGG
jgi:hypothetical protein